MEDWVPISIHSGMALPYQGMPWMVLTSKRKKMNDKWKVSENCNPGWTAEPLKPHRFVAAPA
jgi:hypothetical protein